jgi:DNA repair exonuclease SbcCD ATPase subunit
MLQLKKLYLEGFGPIENTKTIEFNQGINLLNGPNGKCKTTIGKAISMLLYNDYETGSSFQDYINWNKDTFFISLDFSVNDVDYKLSLGCKKNKTACITDRKLFNNDGKELAVGEDVIIKMSELLDPVSMYGFFVKQKAIDNIISVSDSARREMFKKIFEFDFNKEIKSIIEPHIDVIKNDIIQIDKEIYSLENTKYDPDIEKPLNSTEEEYNIYVQTVDIIEKSIQVYQSKKELYDTKQKEYITKKEKISQLKNKKLELENSISELNKLVESLTIRNVHDEYQLKINTLKEEFENYQLVSLSSIEKLRSDLDANLITLSTTENTLQSEVLAIKITKIPPFKDTELQALLTQKATVGSRVIELRKIIDADNFSTIESQKLGQELAIEQSDIKKLANDIEILNTGICPICGGNCSNKVEEYKNKSLELQNRVNNLINTIQDIKNNQKKLLETELQTKENEYIELEKALEEQYENKKVIEDKIKLNETNRNLKESLNLKLLNCTTEKEKITTKFNSESQLLLQSIANKENQLQQNIDSLGIQEGKDVKGINNQIDREKLSITEKESSITTYNIEIDTLEKENIEIVTWLENNNINETEVDTVKYNELKDQVSTYNRTLIENEHIRKNNELLVIKQKEDLKLLVEKRKIKEQLVQDKYDYEQAKVILQNEFPNFAIDQEIQDIENEMNNFIELVYPKSLNVNLRSTKTTIKLEYGTGKVMKDASMLSGAESKIVQMAFTNIFNRKLNLQCLILDEPDAALDDINKQELYSTLVEMKYLYSQMIITTHSEKMKNYLLSSCGEDVNLIAL